MKIRHSFNRVWWRRFIFLTFLIGVTTASPATGIASKPPVIVVNSGYRLLIDSEKGTIVAFRSTLGPSSELLIPGHADLPMFKIEFLDDHSQFKTVTSLDAKHVTVSRSRNEDGLSIEIEYNDIAQLPLDVQVRIRCPFQEPLTYWNLVLNNRTTFWVGHIQFPVIEVPFDSRREKHNSHILWSFADGALAGPVESSLAGRLDYDSPETWRANNYPGQWASTQLMAYYDDSGGLYIACDDPKGLPKFLNPLMAMDGVVMGLGHYPATRGPSNTKLPYNVVLGTFLGDWYVAAEIYRNWAAQQPFCATKLTQRKDYPNWLNDSPVGISFPMRGQADWDPPAAVNPEYTPLTNALPYLNKLASALASPLMPIIFNWEYGGPWVQPESFPPVGGEAPFREFMVAAKGQGWHPVLYGDGLRWITWQKNTDYDGMPYFKAHGGESAIARNWDGSLMENIWEWRKNYAVCVGTDRGRQMILDMTRGMAQLGPDVVQQFDQGPGPMVCYATDHGHPPVPGPWMTEAFNQLIRSDTDVAKSINPGVALSCEGAPPETYLQDFQVWDAREQTCPLFSFLYHEYLNGFEGFYTNRLNDEALRASVARALVTGYMMNLTLRDKGLVHYDWDQPWTKAIPDQAGILDWSKTANHFRVGPARDYLVYGRMLRPWTVSGVSQRDFGWGKEPSVMTATWRAPDGREGVVLANYADLRESPRVELEGRGNKELILYNGAGKEQRRVELPTVVDLEMEPRSVGLIELR